MESPGRLPWLEATVPRGSLDICWPIHCSLLSEWQFVSGLRLFLARRSTQVRMEVVGYSRSTTVFRHRILFQAASVGQVY